MVTRLLRVREGAPEEVTVGLGAPLGVEVGEGSTVAEIEKEGDAEELTQSVAVRDRDMEGGAVEDTVMVPLVVAERHREGEREPEELGLRVGEAVTEKLAEAEAVGLVVAVTLVQMSTIITDPSAPFPCVTPPPMGELGPTPTPLAA